MSVVKKSNQMRVTDQLAARVLRRFKTKFADAALLPVIGEPSTAGGVAVLTHTMGTNMPMRLAGVTSNSPVANNALYSFQVTGGKYLNLYETMVPDLPGANGEASTTQLYVNKLRDLGLDVAGVHFHWLAGTMVQNDHMVHAIHHQKIGMEPSVFASKTVEALTFIMPFFQRRALPYFPLSVPMPGCPWNAGCHCGASCGCGPGCQCGISDQTALAIQQMWQAAGISDAQLLPVIGMPSYAQGVLTLTCTLGLPVQATINGLPTSSPLVANSLYSAEVTPEGPVLNLFEILIPDIVAPQPGQSSSAQGYVDQLAANGLNVCAVHFHQTGTKAFQNDRGLVAVHHYSTTLSPEDFSQRTISALLNVRATLLQQGVV